jgi:hypothetical protein
LASARTEASSKAEALGRGIATAMSYGTPFGCLGLVFLVASVVAFTVGSIRKPPA